MCRCQQLFPFVLRLRGGGGVEVAMSPRCELGEVLTGMQGVIVGTLAPPAAYTFPVQVWWFGKGAAGWREVPMRWDELCLWSCPDRVAERKETSCATVDKS